MAMKEKVPGQGSGVAEDVFRGNFRMAIVEVMRLAKAPPSLLPTPQDAERLYDKAVKGARNDEEKMRNLANSAMDTCGIPKTERERYVPRVMGILSGWKKDAESVGSLQFRMQSRRAAAEEEEKGLKAEAFNAYCYEFRGGFQRIAAVVERIDQSYVMPSVSDAQIASLEAGLSGGGAETGMKQITVKVIRLLKIDEKKLAPHPREKLEVERVIRETLKLANEAVSDASGAKYGSIDEVRG